MSAPFSESQIRRSRDGDPNGNGTFATRQRTGVGHIPGLDPSEAGSGPDPEHAARIEREARARVAALTHEERMAMAEDPGTHPRTLARIYLDGAAAAGMPLNAILARNENTPVEVKSAILRRTGFVDPATRRHLARTLPDTDIDDAHEPYMPVHRDVRDRIVEFTGLGSAFTTSGYVTSGLLHPDDVTRAMRGDDPDLRKSLAAVDWPRQYPNLTPVVVSEALKAGLDVSRNPRLTPQMQAQCVAHSPAAAQTIVDRPDADHRVLSDLAWDTRPDYDQVSLAAMDRLANGRI